MSLPPIPPPEPACVKGAILGPLLPPREEGRLVFQARTPGVRLEQRRDPEGQPATNGFQVLAPPLFARPEPVSEPCIYGGPMIHHFGHMVAEGVHRLWAATAVERLAGARVVFQVARDAGPPPPWFDDILHLCGIAPERVLLVRTLTRFAELHVPAAGRSLFGTELFPGYGELFPLVPMAREPRTPGPPRRLYVSRRRHVHTGSYLGERYVERVLRRAGFAIVHPEKLRPRAFVRELVNADTVVFAEGSAVHNLQFCGRIEAQVFVIGRRKGAEVRLRQILEAATDRWQVFGEVKRPVSLYWSGRNAAASKARACSFVDIPDLMEALGGFTGIHFPEPAEEAVNTAIALDLAAYLIDERSPGEWTTDAQLGALLRQVQASPRIKSLLNRVGKLD